MTTNRFSPDHEEFADDSRYEYTDIPIDTDSELFKMLEKFTADRKQDEP